MNEGYREAEQKIEIARREGALELDLSDLNLTELPETIGDLTNLMTLDLGCNYEDGFASGGNQLTFLPESLGCLSQLQVLDLTNNNLTELPQSIGNLSRLKELNLQSNGLTDFPESVYKLCNLEELDLQNNNLRRLPRNISKIPNLKSLNLIFNELRTLPGSFKNLHQLQILALSNNQFTSFPSVITEILSLEELYLIDNNIKQLPIAIGKLKSLRKILLGGSQIAPYHEYVNHNEDHGNQLTSLPYSILELEELDELNLDGNPLNPELAIAYEQGFDAVIAYLQAESEDQIVLNEAKLILVGEGEVGKTSLIGALRGDRWVEKRKTTHGVEVDIKSLVVKDIDSETEIILNGWDFGGQNIYRHTHQLFFTAPAVYLAVWNPRRGAEQCRVEEWIKMIKHRACDEARPDEQPHILIVATHGGPKERLDYIDEQILRDEFGDLIVGFQHVDSKSGYGLDELKQIIAKTVANIPQVGRTVPASWKRVLDAVRQRSKTDAWITYEQFQSLCAEQGVDLVLSKTYVAILNELGHLIHYSTDPILKDTVILKPEWLSKAISFILEDKQVKKQNGLVRHDRLSELWDDSARGKDRYPQHLHFLFIKLMEKCDLSYQVELPEAGALPTTLIAQLVPSSRSEGWEKDWILKQGDTEKTQICRVLDAETGRTAEAEGLMYRLIVRFHRYSLGRDNYYESRHWKNGMLLDDGFNGRAFIEEIAGDVYITVRAAYPSGFLGHLCSEVSWLVKSFWKGLDPRLYIPCPTEKCKGLLERDEIMEFKAKKMPEVRCSVCRKFHDIDGLMAITTAKPEWQDAVIELNRGQQKILEAVDNGFGSLSVDLRTLMSQADEQYKALLTALTDPAKDGPRLFSFEPVDPGFWDKPKWVAQKFRLTLWCEHSRLPLTTLNDEDDTSGVYEIELTKAWIKKAAPILRIMSMTLQLALPIAIPGTKLATNDDEYKAITEQLDFAVNSSKSFLQGSDKMGDWLVDNDKTALNKTSSDTRDMIRAQGSVLRELHALLKAQDPSNSFGGLERVQNKRREFLWVHPQFVKDY
jgi:C-terminal of Roc, COR, domain/Ras of Complex, Roc, domain of DAPkinase/Leucine rich repeat